MPASARAVRVLAVASAALLAAGGAAATGVVRAPGGAAPTVVRAGSGAPAPVAPAATTAPGPAVATTAPTAPAVTLPTLPAVTLPAVTVPAVTLPPLPTTTTTTTRPAPSLQANSVYIASSDGSGLRRLGVDAEFGPVRLSPDGARIAFMRGQQLWVAASDGSGAGPVTSGEPVCCNHDWSPDGAEIAYERYNPDRTRRILGVPSVGGAPRVLAEEGLTPVWAPAGGRLMYTSGVSLVVRDPDGTSRQIATDVLGLSAWSPDGTQILASCTDPTTGKPATFVFQADGSGRRRIDAAGDHRRQALSWSPDGAWVTWGGAWPTPESELRTWASRPDGSEVRELGAGTSTPLWVGPGRLLLGAGGTRAELVGVDGTGRRPFLDTTLPYSAYEVSADGRTVVVATGDAPPPPR